jgi:hypothetical protein
MYKQFIPIQLSSSETKRGGGARGWLMQQNCPAEGTEADGALKKIGVGLGAVTVLLQLLPPVSAGSVDINKHRSEHASVAPSPLAKGAGGSGFVKGTVMGEPFKIESALYEQGRRLRLRAAAVGVRNGIKGIDVVSYSGIALDFPVTERLEGQTFIVEASKPYMMVDGKQQPKPDLKRYFARNSYPEEWHNKNRYTMHLKFFKVTKGMLPGYIELKVIETPESPEKTELKGFFYAVPGSGI